MVPAVSIIQTKKNYGKVPALSNINLNIEQNSFFGLLGPNGAGKSTLINIMAGLTHAETGTIKIMGHDVRQQWRQARRVIGVVPQELAYDPFFTIREMLRLQSGYFGLGSANYTWIDTLIETLGLNDKADENLNRLSGGMKRRVLIAQALVHKPKVVVLDEPTAGVDVELRKVLWEFIRQLHKKGHTIILTTHYLEEAESLCDKIAILNQGKLIAHETTKILLDQYPFRLLRLVLKNTPDKLPKIKIKKIISNENNTITLRLHQKKDNIGSILNALHSVGIFIKDLHTDEHRLEDVFLALTNNKGKND